MIPGVCHDNVQISCVDCSTDTGKIAAAYGKLVCIFEPTPLSSQMNEHVSASKSCEVVTTFCYYLSVPMNLRTILYWQGMVHCVNIIYLFTSLYLYSSLLFSLYIIGILIVLPLFCLKHIISSSFEEKLFEYTRS